jgi:hypothetical protein
VESRPIDLSSDLESVPKLTRLPRRRRPEFLTELSRSRLKFLFYIDCIIRRETVTFHTQHLPPLHYVAPALLSRSSYSRFVPMTNHNHRCKSHEKNLRACNPYNRLVSTTFLHQVIYRERTARIAQIGDRGTGGAVETACKVCGIGRHLRDLLGEVLLIMQVRLVILFGCEQ